MSMMKGGESYRRTKHEGESRKTNMGCWNGNGSDAHTIIIMIQTTDSVGWREWAERISHYIQNTQTHIEQFSIFRGAAITHFSEYCSSWTAWNLWTANGFSDGTFAINRFAYDGFSNFLVLDIGLDSLFKSWNLWFKLIYHLWGHWTWHRRKMSAAKKSSWIRKSVSFFFLFLLPLDTSRQFCYACAPVSENLWP